MADRPHLQVLSDALNLHRRRQHGHLRVAYNRKGARDRPACLDGHKRVVQPTMEECGYGLLHGLYGVKAQPYSGVAVHCAVAFRDAVQNCCPQGHEVCCWKLAHLVLFKVHASPQVVATSRSLVAVQLQGVFGKTRSFTGRMHSYSS